MPKDINSKKIKQGRIAKEINGKWYCYWHEDGKLYIKLLAKDDFE